MHELSLADAVLTIVRDHAHGRRVTAVDVKVGRLRQVVPDALEFAFELLAAGTNVEGATLELEHVPVRVQCGACDVESEQDGFPFACTSCGDLAVDVVAGDELRVESIELADEPVLSVGGR
jgi:hydrogenase nickel incorporation protein HypA/HybF